MREPNSMLSFLFCLLSFLVFLFEPLFASILALVCFASFAVKDLVWLNAGC